jgi:chromosome transmission fidelity protein 8
MIILGHHVLYGKVVPLEKPIVLLKKVVSKVPTFTDIEEDETDERMEETDDKIEPHKTQTEYLVSAVIKRKILFNKRPRPIVYLEPKKKF